MPSDFQDGDLIEAGHLKQYSGEAYYSVAGGGSTSSAYVATVIPAPLSGYPVGMVINFKPNADNAASPTLNVNGLGAKAIVKNGSTPLAATDLKNGQVVSLVYDGTNFQMVAASAGGGSSVTDLNSLTDVTVSGASPGQVLRKSAGDWVNSAIQASDLPSHNHDGSQITTGQVAPARLSSNAPNSSQFLRGDGTWAAVSGGASDLNGLTDVTITTPATGEFVRKSAGDWVNSGIQASDLPAGIDAANIGGGSVSNTEFATLDGVTSSIQTQLNGKAASSHTHAAADITSGQLGLARGGTGADLSATGGAGQVLKQSSAGGAVSVGALSASDMPSGIDAARIGGGAVSNTEFATLDGVTSAIQTQLNGKAPTISIIQLNRSNDYTLSASNSYMSLPWEASEFNSGGGSAWQSGVNPDRITLYRAGYWLVGANVTFQKAGTPTLVYCHTRVCKNGSGEFTAESHPRISTTNETCNQAYSGVIYSDGDDYASLQVFSDGANHKIRAYCKIWAIFLGGG